MNPKLVRDKIPEQITRRGARARLDRIAPGDHEVRRGWLFRKLREELLEVELAPGPPERQRELADLLEAMLELVRCDDAAAGVGVRDPLQLLQSLRQAKLEANGGFGGGVILLEVIDPSPGHPVGAGQT